MLETRDIRYLVFEVTEYYPSGGISDLKTSFDDLVSVRDFIKGINEAESQIYEFQIYDRLEGYLIDYNNNDFYYVDWDKDQSGDTLIKI